MSLTQNQIANRKDRAEESVDERLWRRTALDREDHEGDPSPDRPGSERDDERLEPGEREDEPVDKASDRSEPDDAHEQHEKREAART